MTRHSRIYGLHSLKDLLSGSLQRVFRASIFTPSLQLFSASFLEVSCSRDSKKRVGPACCSRAAAHFTTVKREHMAPCLEAVWKTTHKCPMRHTSSRPGQQINNGETREKKKQSSLCAAERGEIGDARAVRNGPIGEVRAIYHLKSLGMSGLGCQ